MDVPVDIFHDNWDRLARGESWESSLPVRDGSDVKAAFREVISAAGRCTVRIKCDNKDAAMGTIVGPDGWILTKASELSGQIVCRMRDERELPAQLIGVLPAFDLAMLKIELTDLPVIEFSCEEPAVGQWVASLALSDDPLTIGVVSVPRRKIPPPRGFLGVLLKDVPGMGKTILARAIAKSIQGSFNRIQLTPDLLPSDILGVSIYDSQTG
ncbi:hypothetical protein LCGC14_3019480, partial [marine sediment metagenome]